MNKQQKIKVQFDKDIAKEITEHRIKLEDEFS